MHLGPAQLITLISDHPYGVPVRDMESLLSQRQDAASAVIAFLEASNVREPEGPDLLWPVVVLGELRDPRGIPILTHVLQEAPGLEWPVAATEALAKVGRAAVEPLAWLLETEARPRTRILVYAALGLMDLPEAWGILERRLEEDPEFDFVIARAMAGRNLAEDLTRVHKVYERAESWKRVALEETLMGMISGRLPWEFPQRDWRIRYRRDPRRGLQIPLTWPAVMVLMWEAKGELRPDRRELPLSLDQLRRRARALQEDDRCGDCGQLLRSPTGIPLCDEVAEDLISFQLQQLESWRGNRWEDIHEVLDELDQREMEALQWPEDTDEERSIKGEALDAIDVFKRTLYWVTAEGLTGLSQAERRLRVILQEVQADH